MSKNSNEFKSAYVGIFASNYFTQGINQSIFAIVIPIYLLSLLGSVDPAALAFMLTIVLVPFIFKLFYGILSDKVKIKKLGRRKPWIILPVSFSGILWIIIPSLIMSNPSSAMSTFTYFGLIISLGVAMTDTAMDGFILDICPKEQLGRTQGICWGFRSLGTIIGGPIILLFLVLIPIELIFSIVGILMIGFSFLTLLIKEVEDTRSINVLSNMKSIFKRGENWKVFTYSFFGAIADGVIVAFLSLYIIVKMGLLNPIGATLDTLEGDLSLYDEQAMISLIIGLGIIVGAILGGVIADKISRRLSVYISFLLTFVALLLLLVPVPVFLILVFAFIIGSSSGWSNSSFSAVSGEYSKQYPEITSTYFSLCTSFINLGTMLGLMLTGILFDNLTGPTTDITTVFGTIFLFMAFISIIGIVPFLLLDRNQYEFKSQTE